MDIDNYDRSPLTQAIAKVYENWGWFLALGIGQVILGVFVLSQAVIATLASMYALGILMVIAGIFTIIAAFRAKDWGYFALWLLSGILYLLAGVGMMWEPGLAAGTLTMLIGMAFFVFGFIRVWLGLKARPSTGWGWMVLDGVLCVILAVMIFWSWPVNSLWLIGTLLGIQMIVQGWGYISLGLALRLNKTAIKSEL